MYTTGVNGMDIREILNIPLIYQRASFLFSVIARESASFRTGTYATHSQTNGCGPLRLPHSDKALRICYRGFSFIQNVSNLSWPLGSMPNEFKLGPYFTKMVSRACIGKPTTYLALNRGYLKIAFPGEVGSEHLSLRLSAVPGDYAAILSQ